jgi:hypothetical protein
MTRLAVAHPMTRLASAHAGCARFTSKHTNQQGTFEGITQCPPMEPAIKPPAPREMKRHGSEVESTE